MKVSGLILVALALAVGAAHADERPEMETLVVTVKRMPAEERLSATPAPVDIDFSGVTIAPPRLDEVDNSREPEIELALAAREKTKS